ncbi:MAG TPA: UDP-N-acetylmuramate--L-alanine ligase [Nitrospiria bacterium]|nr:UDP-N-acetylmuramate--L-alanine ligase [Nitrospiria bacterium]
MFGKIQQIHFVGIGGAGMSGIAEILLNMGYRVTGSDLSYSETVKRLEGIGGKIFIGHHPSNIGPAQVVVVSSAVSPQNPEVLAARERLIPVIPRAAMLVELMRLKYGIAIAGAHGKTTTTSLVASVLAEGGLDPTAVIGGKAYQFGSNAKLGQGDLLVAEADESDGSFLRLSPIFAIVTTIDREHLDYYHDLDRIQRAFLDFLNKVPFYGLAVVCLDQESIQEIIPQLHVRYVTFGMTPQADLVGSKVEFKGWESEFTVHFRQKNLGRFRLALPGLHNVYNALAAIAVGLELEVGLAAIRKALSEFAGVERRFQLVGEKRGIMIVDDYGHHPTEIKATLSAAKTGWNRRLLVVFQPHRYTRTRDLLKEFGTAFYQADSLILTEIYAAGEPPIEGVTGQSLYDQVKQHGYKDVRFLPTHEAIVEQILAAVRPGDMILTLGAGDIWKVGTAVLKGLEGGTE